MINKISAGLLMYRIKNSELELLLAHPGGPYWESKDAGYWGIPKGEVETNEALFEAAQREFFEETGIKPQGNFIDLGTVTLSSGKTVYAWAFENEWDNSSPIISNLFDLEWPPNSGIIASFPEIDQATFFPLPIARQKINAAQAKFIDRLVSILHETPHH
jgi:predicted NUDIX family NTP pyrophosphohydrolase